MNEDYVVVADASGVHFYGVRTIFQLIGFGDFFSRELALLTCRDETGAQFLR